MKKLILGGVLIALAALPVAPGFASDPISVAGLEGCAVGPNDTCTYTATRGGGYVGAGSFTVSVKRGVATTIHTAPGVCTGIIVPGDIVTVAVTVGSAAAGNPLPPQADGQTPPGTNCLN
jgi:hypothetical protein